MRDAFYRWDGVSYYASFSEFLPGVALISIIWSIIAILTAGLIWLVISITESLWKRFDSSFNADHFNVFIYCLVILGAVFFYGKRLFFGFGSTLQQKLTVLIFIISLAIFVTWFLREKNERINKWIDIQGRITPLVWLFGIFIIISMFIVSNSLLTQKRLNKWELLQEKRSLTAKESFDNIRNSPKVTMDNKSQPNIILFTFDALTAENMSSYGYHRKTTPFIDKWAEQATLFKRAESESNHSASALATLMTGKKTWSHRKFHQVSGTRLIHNDLSSLPLQLKRNGYFNMALMSNALGDPYVLGMSDSFDIAPPASDFHVHTYLFGYIKKLLYDLFYDKILLYDWLIHEDFIFSRYAPARFKYLTKTEFPPDKTFNKFFDLYDHNIPSPFFVWIHVMPPHDPYVPPEPYMGLFNSSDKFRTAEEYERHTRRYQKLLAQFKNKNTLQPFPKEMKPDIDILQDRYDEFIVYCDKKFEEFIAGLEKRDLLDTSVVILSSDHGESFKLRYLEHGGEHLFEQVTHIPLIIKEPNQKEGLIVHDIVEQADIPATILDLAHIDVPTQMEGRSLKPLLRGNSIIQRPAYSMVLMKNRAENRIANGTLAVWDGDYKLIHYLSKNKSLLYNLKNDGEEENNLIEVKPEVATRLLYLIFDELRNVNESR